MKLDDEFRSFAFEFSTISHDKLLSMAHSTIRAVQVVKPLIDLYKSGKLGPELVGGFDSQNFEVLLNQLNYSMVRFLLPQGFLETLHRIDWKKFDSLKEDDIVPDRLFSPVKEILSDIYGSYAFKNLQSVSKKVFVYVLLPMLVNLIYNVSIGPTVEPQIRKHLHPEIIEHLEQANDPAIDNQQQCNDDDPEDVEISDK